MLGGVAEACRKRTLVSRKIYHMKTNHKSGCDDDGGFVLFGSSVQNSERGKKIGNAMMTTSRSVVQTGKVVGKRNVRENAQEPEKCC